MSFPIYGDTRGFSFSVAGGEQKIMGDEVEFATGLSLKATAPLAGHFELYKDGKAIDQKFGTTADFAISLPGVYRVEVYLESLPAPATGEPWIISNPIYVRSKSAALPPRV